MNLTTEPMNIMIVDDTPANLRLLSKILDKAGYEVRALPSGELAIDSAIADPPALILLDVRMPTLNGYEVCARLKAEARTREVPVIFISALQETEDKVRAFEAGGVDYITKPFQQAEVLARVDTHLQLARMRAELVASRERAESANRAKSAFLANMSHELRTPLNAVLGYAQILEREENLDPRVRSAVEVIHQGGEYLLTLINEVLDLAKVEAGRFEIHPVPFHPAEFFPDIVTMFRIRATQKGIGFVYHEQTKLPFILKGDNKRLRQVVMNLLGNAIKFTPAGEVRLEVGYVDDHLEFSVIDSGVGIDEEHISHIFQPFGQSGEHEYKVQGTGLGLAISRNLVELMQGKITVTSRLGEGSRFSVSIPMEQEEPTLYAGAVGGPSHRVTGYRRSDASSQPLQLLVADDNEHNRAVLNDLLGPLGFTVEAFSNGEEVLERLQRGHADLLITDLALSGINGLETMQRIFSLPGLESFPVIVLSGSSFPADKAASRNAGARAHLDKPVNQYELYEVMAQNLPLEWLVEEEEESLDDVEPLPDAWREELIELSRRGLLTRLVDRLKAFLVEKPEHPLLLALYEDARHFDIARLKEQLNRL